MTNDRCKSCGNAMIGYEVLKEALSEQPPEIRFVQGEFSKIEIGEGDWLVLSHPGILSEIAHEHLKAAMEGHFPGHKCIVFEEGLTLGAIEEEVLHKGTVSELDGVVA